jgi:hypothetical protein
MEGGGRSGEGLEKKREVAMANMEKRMMFSYQ